MKKLKYFLLLFEIIRVIKGNSNIEGCLESTKPHETECNKYFKCVRMPNNSYVWLPLSCHEGLVYDKNLRSCVIPEFEWDCLRKNEASQISGDDENVYGVDNLEIYEDRLSQQTERSEETPEIFDENFMEKSGDDEFMEVIDGQEDFGPINQHQNARIIEIDSSGEKSDEVIYSGDGFVDFTTPSSVAITTHLQRLTQLMEKVWQNDESESTIEPESELTPADLNRFLTQKTIQMESTKNFNDETKTPMPANGEIHPEIMTEVLKKQQKIHKDALKLVTIPMDQTTPTIGKNNFLFMGQDSMTDIELKSGANPNHQIVVNRPEGSVLFNVPIQQKTKENLPVLSEEVLKTVLEISKQLASQRHPTKNVYIPHNYVQPIYYPYPIPMNTNTGGSNFAVKNNSNSENQEKLKTKGNLKDKESWHSQENHRPYGDVSMPGDYMGITYQNFPGNRFGDLKGNSRNPGSFINSRNPGTKNPGNQKTPDHSKDPEAYDSYEDQFPYNPAYYQNFHQSSPIYYNRVNQPQNYQDRYGSLAESSSSAQIRHGSLKNKVKINNRHDIVKDSFKNRQDYIQEDYYHPFRPNNGNKKFSQIYRNPYPEEQKHHMKHSYHNPNNDDIAYDSEDEENGPVVIDSSAHYLEHANKRQKIRNKNKPLVKESISFDSNFKKKNDFAAYEDDETDDAVEGEAEESYDDSSRDKLVNLGGHYYNIENFKKNVLPLLKNEDKVDVLECSVGTRQPNATDCKRYYVCNPQTKHVSSYACPTFTAFNEKSRMCDSKSYSTCKSQQESKNSVNENRWIHMETLKALAQAKAEAQKAQKIANMLRRQQQISNNEPVEPSYEEENEEVQEDEEEEPDVPIYIPTFTTTTTTTTKPPRRKSSTSTKQKKKKRAKCREPGKFFDPNSTNHYFLCFLDQESNKLKRKKIPCASGLIFCKQSKFCTLQSKCNQM